MTDTEQIIAFLNARLAEFNEKVEEAQTRGDLKIFYPTWGEMRDDWNVYTFGIPLAAAERMVATFRSIVDMDECMACQVEHQPCDMKNDTLLALAGIWNDHPDYLKLSIL